MRTENVRATRWEKILALSFGNIEFKELVIHGVMPRELNIEKQWLLAKNTGSGVILLGFETQICNLMIV